MTGALQTNLKLQDCCDRNHLAFRVASWVQQPRHPEHFKHDAAGYVITDQHMMTSVPGLFAAGDLRVQLTRQITTAVGDATTAAIAVEKYLAVRKKAPRRRRSVARLKIHCLPNGAFAENCYLVADRAAGEAVLIDPGEDAPMFLQRLASEQLRLSAVWLTTRTSTTSWACGTS